MKFCVTGSVRCIVDADGKDEAEEILYDYLQLADTEEGIVQWEEITIDDATEVDE